MSIPGTRHTVIDDRKLAWREAGQGPAMVFIHGMGGNSRNWETQYAQFSDRYRVIGWDARLRRVGRLADRRADGCRLHCETGGVAQLGGSPTARTWSDTPSAPR